jgi:hypothetical protein
MGYASNTCTGSSGSKYTQELYFDVNSQDISGNKSNVTVTYILYRNDGYANSAYNSNSGSNSADITINGTSEAWHNLTIDTRNGSTVTLATWTGDLTHDAAGNLTVTVGGNFVCGTSSLTGGSVSASWTLPTIPRSSQCYLGNGAINAGSSTTCYIQPNSSGFSHYVAWGLGSYSKGLTIPAGTTQCTVDIPMSWLNAMPNATQMQGWLELDTYDASGNHVGDYYLIAFDAYCPSSVIPSFSSILDTVVNPDNLKTWTNYVQNQSKSTLQISGAAGSYGSTIKNYSISGAGYSFSSGTASAFTTGILKTAGTLSISATITDSRGRTATRTKTITVDTYSIPGITSLEVYRCDAAGNYNNEGTYFRTRVVYTFDSASGQNVCHAEMDCKTASGTYVYQALTVQNATALIKSGVSVDKTYTIVIRVIDAISTITYQILLQSSPVVFDIKSDGTGFAVGKVSEFSNTFETLWNIRATNGLTMGGQIQPISTSPIGIKCTTYNSQNNVIYFAGDAIYPGIDNATNMGSANGYMWKAVYARNGVIQTSAKETKGHIHYIGKQRKVSDDKQLNDDVTLDDIMDFIQKLNPSTFIYKDADGNDVELADAMKRDMGSIQLGLIADDIKDEKLFKYVGINHQYEVEVKPPVIVDGEEIEPAVMEARTTLGLQPLPLAILALTACQNILSRVEALEEKIGGGKGK